MKENRINTTGGSQAPSQSNDDTRIPDQNKQEGEDLREGSIRKAEETSSSRDAFGDDYAVEQENEISREKVKTEPGND